MNQKLGKTSLLFNLTAQSRAKIPTFDEEDLSLKGDSKRTEKLGGESGLLFKRRAS
jgi:hypothetical protein